MTESIYLSPIYLTLVVLQNYYTAVLSSEVLERLRGE